LSHSEVTSNLLCFEDNSGTVTITVDPINVGTTPYTYSFNNGTNYGNDNNADYLYEGNHTIIVQDANGCLSTSLINLTEPTQLALLPQSSNDATCFGYNDGNATVNIDATSGTRPYTYAWSATGIGNIATANNLTAGGYVVDITDNNGCILQETFVLGKPAMVTI
jgi:hypothetical protein